MLAAELEEFYPHVDRSRLIYFHQGCIDYLSLDELVDCIKSPAKNYDEHLGRGETRVLEGTPDFSVLIRTSLRGGFFSRFCRRNYFNFPPSKDPLRLRQVKELCALSYLRKKSVSVPFPVAAVMELSCGGLFYKGHLATKCIAGADNLFILARGNGLDEKALYAACYQVGREALKMLEAGVFHPDLHPGNALWANDKAYLIDFDRAFYFGEKYLIGNYKKKLLARWQRYSAKHGLGELINEPFKRGLYGLK